MGKLLFSNHELIKSYVRTLKNFVGQRSFLNGPPPNKDQKIMVNTKTDE